MKRLFAPLLVLALALTACDENEYNHNPAPGRGAVVVDNRTGSKFHFYVDGVKLERIGEQKERSYDLAPGVHRIVLDEDDGREYFAEELDILEGRLTIVEIYSRAGGFSTSTDIHIYLED